MYCRVNRRHERMKLEGEKAVCTYLSIPLSMLLNRDRRGSPNVLEGTWSHVISPTMLSLDVCFGILCLAFDKSNRAVIALCRCILLATCCCENCVGWENRRHGPANPNSAYLARKREKTRDDPNTNDGFNQCQWQRSQMVAISI